MRLRPFSATEEREPGPAVPPVPEFARSTDEDRAVRRDRVVRKLLGGSLILVGGAMLLGGIGVL